MISICTHGGLVRSMVGGVNGVKERGWKEKGENEGKNERTKKKCSESRRKEARGCQRGQH